MPSADWASCPIGIRRPCPPWPVWMPSPGSKCRLRLGAELARVRRRGGRWGPRRRGRCNGRRGGPRRLLRRAAGNGPPGPGPRRDRCPRRGLHGRLAGPPRPPWLGRLLGSPGPFASRRGLRRLGPCGGIAPGGRPLEGRRRLRSSACLGDRDGGRGRLGSPRHPAAARCDQQRDGEQHGQPGHVLPPHPVDQTACPACSPLRHVL